MAGVTSLARAVGVLPLLLSQLALPVLGWNNGAAPTPVMGWRSWNCYHGDVNDSVIRMVVDAVVRPVGTLAGRANTSLRALGYVHVGVDDGWQGCGKGRKLNQPGPNTSFHALNGTPVVNTSKFPDLSSLVNYGHERGLKMGW